MHIITLLVFSSLWDDGVGDDNGDNDVVYDDDDDNVDNNDDHLRPQSFSPSCLLVQFFAGIHNPMDSGRN